jgi:metal-dependent amidase/aminoacylase/carboxypeptidase family protein
MHRHLIQVLLLLPFAVGGCDSAETPGPTQTLRVISAEIDRVEPSLIELRRDIHMHPEVSGQEQRTAGLVAQRLRALGYEVRAGVGGHGVVAVLRATEDAPVVAYRADMDAVVSPVVGDQPYRSQVPNVKHVCGHDLHTAVGIGVASALAAARLPATLVFVFQPAEENVQGARAMLRDGALDGLTPDAFFAIHTAPLAVGSILVTPGGGLAGFQGMEVSWPVDRDYATEISAALTSVSTLPPFDPEAPPGDLVEDFISVQLAGAPIRDAERMRLPATIKTAHVARFADAQHRIVESIGKLGHDGIDVRFDEAILPPMKSDPQLAQESLTALREVFGDAGVQVAQGTIPHFGEDFVFFQQVAPGAMFFLGVANPERGITALNHSPDYDVDETAIALGAKAMANVIAHYVHAGTAVQRGSVSRIDAAGLRWIGSTDGWLCKVRASVGSVSESSSADAPVATCP